MVTVKAPFLPPNPIRAPRYFGQLSSSFVFPLTGQDDPSGESGAGLLAGRRPRESKIGHNAVPHNAVPLCSGGGREQSARGDRPYRLDRREDAKRTKKRLS
jgi:hypothetical protein